MYGRGRRKPAISAGIMASQYCTVSNAALPPVIIKSVAFMAISIPIIEMNDMENAVFRAKVQLNNSMYWMMPVFSCDYFSRNFFIWFYFCKMKHLFICYWFSIISSFVKLVNEIFNINGQLEHQILHITECLYLFI